MTKIQYETCENKEENNHVRLCIMALREACITLSGFMEKKNARSGTVLTAITEVTICSLIDLTECDDEGIMDYLEAVLKNKRKKKADVSKEK